MARGPGGLPGLGGFAEGGVLDMEIWGLGEEGTCVRRMSQGQSRDRWGRLD